MPPSGGACREIDHGPRLNRYSLNYAMYLGHHHGFRRETGEPQLTFNYYRAFSDFINRFSFGQGCHFRSPKATEAIVPDLLKMIWEEHNDKERVLLEIGQLGGVTGDAFIKIAYEEPYEDTAGNFHPGRVRLLPLNPAFCFPEFHPHDKERFIRFKLKYRFFGTSLEGTRQVFTYTEILTEDVIEEYINDELIDQRANPLGVIPVVHIPNYTVSGSPWGLPDCFDIISLNRHYNEVAENLADIINYHCVDDETEILTDRGWLRQSELTVHDRALALDPGTDEIVWADISQVNRFDYNGDLIRWDNHIDALTTPGHRWVVERRVGRDRRYVRDFVTTSEGEYRSTVPTLQQGSRIVVGGGVPVHFPTEAKYTDEFVETVGWWVTEGSIINAPSGTRHGVLSQSERVNRHHVADIRRLAAYWKSGGHKFTERPSTSDSGCVSWYLGKSVVDALDEAGANKQISPGFLRSLTHSQAVRLRQVLLAGDGTSNRGRDVWYQDDTERRDAFQMLSSMLGMRTRSFDNVRGDGVVDTYRKSTILAEHTPSTPVHYEGVVWCPTTSTGTWLARRNGVTFWTGNSAPVTIITGAKIDNLEKGASKVWAGLPKDSQVFNLEGGYQGLQGGLAYLEMLKRSMHEMVGVPETALGQVQPISNTSGVALSIQFQPLMNRRAQKVAQYGKGLERINEYALRTLALKEPDRFIWNEDTDTPLAEGQLPELDLMDPMTYQSYAHFPPPLPLDKLVVLNEIQQKMQLGLESREGALRTLGEEFPEQKLHEIRAELKEDALQDGTLQLMKAQIQKQIMDLTGMQVTPDGAAIPMEPVMQADGDVIGDGITGPNPTMQINPLSLELEQDIQNRLVTDAYGSKLAQFRAPDSSNSSEE